MKRVFLDNASTTCVTKEVLDVVNKYLVEDFYNPSAEYKASNEVAKKISDAREFVLNRLGITTGTILFTSGATESNNLAIRGSLREGDWEYLFSSGEHSSVYNVAKALSNEGKTVGFVPLCSNGQVDYDKLGEMVNDKTRLVSLIFVSNETGAINDIKKAVEIIKSKNRRTMIHVDGVQAFNKIELSIDELGIDLFSYSAHKFHGMKGAGGLYVKNPYALKSLVFGGGQEFGKRSGTENVAGIMSTVEAIKNIDIKENYNKVKALHDVAIAYFKDKPDVSIAVEDGSPYIISLSFTGVNGETLMRALEDEVIVGKGSACGSKSTGNRVLQAMGFDMARVKSSIRISFDYNNTIEEIDFACNKIYEVYKDIFNRVK